MLKEYLAAARNIFLPALCFNCEAKIKGGYLCKACVEKIEFLYPPLCRLCSKPIDSHKTGLCKDCIGKIPPYEKVICIARYKEPLINLIHLFKYKNCDYLIDLFSHLMHSHLLKLGFNCSSYDLVTSVPMYRGKIRNRDYNQSSLLAQSFANYFKICFKDDIIYELEERISQTKILASKRRENVSNVFCVKSDVTDKKIILIDDIFTTGATTKECACVLKEAGAKEITIIALSKTF